MLSYDCGEGFYYKGR